MRTVTAYEAFDGVKFDTAVECIEYECAKNPVLAEVDDFLSSEENPYRDAPAQRNMARKSIMAWELWKGGC